MSEWRRSCGDCHAAELKPWCSAWGSEQVKGLSRSAASCRNEGYFPDPLLHSATPLASTSKETRRQSEELWLPAEM